MIAALYVQTNGCYFNLPNVDPWDEKRDARLYPGPYPVIAHPPCQRWGKMWMGSPPYVAKTGIRKKKGDDGGCFKAALAAVRKYGGVLEHPKFSYAWKHFKLNIPPRGGWIMADEHGGFTCCVEQGRYGHWMRKPTWLYAVGCDLPELEWGESKPTYPDWAIKKYGIERLKRMGEIAFLDNWHKNATPPEFMALLIKMAETAGAA